MIRLLLLAGACWASYRMGQESVYAQQAGLDEDSAARLPSASGDTTGTSRTGAVGTDAEVMTMPPSM